MDAGLPLCRDAVLVLPGIMGSELVDTATGDVLWGLSPRSYARLWATRGGFRRLQLTDEERAGTYGRVRATNLLRFPSASPGLGGFEPYTALVRRIRGHVPHPEAVGEFPYDWRLPVAANATLLADVADAHLSRWRVHPQGSRDVGLILVAHSMGGLVAGYFTEQLGGDAVVRRTITLGTPFHGAVKAAALLNSGRGAPVPLPRARLRALAATLPGVHDLLPSYRCVDDGAQSRRLTPADVEALGGDRELAGQSLRLHRLFARPDRNRLSTVVGVDQPTMQSMWLHDGVVTPQPHLRSDDRAALVDHGGDGTVYVEAALGGVEPIASLPQSHAGLARTPEARAAVAAALVRQRLGPPMAARGPGLDVPDTAAVGQPCEICIHAGSGAAPGCRVVDLETNAQIDRPLPVRRGGKLRAVTRLPKPGAYRVEVKGGGYSAVTAIVLALPADHLTPTDSEP